MKTVLTGFIIGGSLKDGANRFKPLYLIDAKVAGELNSGIEPVVIKNLPVASASQWHSLGSKIKITVEILP